MTVTLAPGETKEVTYTPPVLQSAVTFVSSELSYKDTTSLLHVRYVRDGVDEVRMNFPGVSTYPLKKGEPVDIFSCVHSTNIPLVKDGVLTLTLLDEKGDTLHSYTYSGNITSPMMGVKEAFTPASDTENFTLTATLKLAGKTIDSMSLSYSCKDIDPSLCPTAQVPVENTEEGGVPFWYVLVPLTILMLIGGLVFYRSNKKKLEGNVQQP